MNKQTKMILGVAALGAVGYYFWNKSKTSPKANAVGRSYQGSPCRCHTSSSNGVYFCGDGSHYSGSSVGPCPRGRGLQ